MVTSPEVAAEGLAALAAGDVEGARRALDGADSPQAHVLPGVVAFTREDFGASSEHWESARGIVAQADAAGDLLQAAAP